MIDYLVKLDDSIVGRYRTLIRNIKGMSNSYYDSYLDLLETTVKRIIESNNIEYDTSKTCGVILRDEVVENFFLNMGLDSFILEKIKDYIKKVNDHKHKKEKTLGIESVINQMKIYHSLIYTYFMYLDGTTISEFDAEYYVSIYGITEKENRTLKKEAERIKSELEILSSENKLSKEDNETFKEILSIKNNELLSLDEQNHELQNQISKLKDIKLNSMEEKLNKAIDLLNNLTQSVIESRAIGIAVGESIIGKDITKTIYMDKARESMHNGK